MTQSLHELKEAAEAAETDFDRVQISVGGGMRATKTVPAYIAIANPATIKALIADYERVRGALETIAEGHDVGRHDGLPEDGPAHDADTMFALARQALTQGESA
ncbi:hypothetical protein IWC96_14655 [Brevundimonas sp. BAL450]|uniref:hypothetical protein n=1 Tax=Brevundimonas sp. BAL450 TaxID=1708162 RepID=UPI0018C9EF68|nr:hypothetical protein [Brevundimonas sp. BAL450]MBG7616516.1 hypothetical protein [Brevundimonas sp. BAL450]